LQTATANVFNDSKSKNLRILFDLGSQLSYITPSAAESLNLTPTGSKSICIKSFGGHAESKTLNMVNFKVRTNAETISINALCNDICHPLKNYRYEIKDLHEFENVQIADAGLEFNETLKVDILIGADYYWKFVTNELIRSSKGLVGTSTKLGYIFSGAVNDESLAENYCSTLSAHVLKCQTYDEEMNTTLKKFWEIEEVGVEAKQQPVLEKFEADIKFDENVHRYEVRLPFLEKYELLNDNLENSKRRMKGLLQKFKSNEELLHEYDTIIKEQLELGIIELPETDTITEGITYYMPHRPVLRDGV